MLWAAFVRFATVEMIGKRINIATALSTVAGKTTVPNKMAKGPGNPAIKNADPKKMMPEISVPMAVNTISAGSFFASFPEARSKP